MSLEQARMIFKEAAQELGLAGGNFDEDGLLSISLPSRAVPRINIAYLPPEECLLIYAPTARVPERVEGEVYRELMQREFLFVTGPVISYALEPETRVLTMQMKRTIVGLSGADLAGELELFLSEAQDMVAMVLRYLKNGVVESEDEYGANAKPDAGAMII